jgi:ferredoxin
MNSLKDFSRTAVISITDGNSNPNQSILERLEAKGESPTSHCRDGFCGACRVTVLSGQAEHFNSPLGFHDEETQVLACISRLVSDEAELGFN